MYLTLPLPSSRCSIYVSEINTIESFLFSIFNFFKNKLKQCIELFRTPEKMEGESRWKCSRCKTYRDAVKRIDIWKLPQILIIHLKRFKYQGIWRDKISTFVDFPIDNLNLDNFVSSQSKNNNFKLYAVSNHSGTMDGGHYTAMCRHFQFDKWFKFDDSEVKDMNGTSDVVSPMSYILFYGQ
jgi:ubiquitin carboxyl-terminal hydrolase 8